MFDVDNIKTRGIYGDAFRNLSKREEKLLNRFTFMGFIGENLHLYTKKYISKNTKICISFKNKKEWFLYIFIHDESRRYDKRFIKKRVKKENFKLKQKDLETLDRIKNMC
ncbi:MAG: hypothetical protein M0R03_15960 [Novosphingobium sp.]|nr:hypothetical protein [Novosphingobium sp.]